MTENSNATLIRSTLMTALQARADVVAVIPATDVLKSANPNKIIVIFDSGDRQVVTLQFPTNDSES